MTTGQRRNFQRCTWCGCIAAFLSSSSFWDFFLLHLGLSHNCNSISELDFFLDSFLDLFQYLFHIYIPPLRLYAFLSSSVWDFFLPSEDRTERCFPPRPSMSDMIILPQTHVLCSAILCKSLRQWNSLVEVKFQTWCISLKARNNHARKYLMRRVSVIHVGICNRSRCII